MPRTPDPALNGAPATSEAEPRDPPPPAGAASPPMTLRPTDGAAPPLAPSGHEPEHLSWSQMQAWLHCPKAYEYRYVLRVPEEFTPNALALGTAVHAGLAHHYRTLLESGAAPAPEQVRAALDASLAAHDPPVKLDEGQTLDALAAQAAGLAAAVIASPIGTPPGQIIGVEEPLVGSLSPDLPLFHAYVDLITLDRAGSGGIITIRDFKTSRSTWSSTQVREHAGQLAIYKALLPVEASTTVRLEFVTITKGKATKVEPVPIDDHDARPETVVLQAQAILAGLRAGCFPARPGWGCGSCPYRARCPHAAV